MRAVLIIAAIAIVCLAGIGTWQMTDDGSESGSDSEQPTTRETADPLPPLPRGWSETVNAAGGFTLGVPPGWSARTAVAKTTLASPGSGAVVSVTADRTNEAIEADLGQYASGIAAKLAPDRSTEPLPDPPVPDAPGYESAGVRVIGDAIGLPAKPGGPGSEKAGGQRLEVIVVRRTALAAYPILIASDRGVKPAALAPIVARLVRSLRGRPVAPIAD